MMQLNEELTSTENKVSFARQAFNDAVTTFNTQRGVPQQHLCRMFGFKEADLFEVKDEAVKRLPRYPSIESRPFLTRASEPGTLRWTFSSIKSKPRARQRVWSSLWSIGGGTDRDSLPVDSGYTRYVTREEEAALSLWNPELLFWVVLGNSLVIGCGSLLKILELRGDGGKIAQMLGGRLVHPETKDPAEQRLMNVVEEMAIASGVTMPEVYVLKDRSINAFAAGSNPSEAVIGVTTGCMHLLSETSFRQ